MNTIYQLLLIPQLANGNANFVSYMFYMILVVLVLCWLWELLTTKKRRNWK